MLAQQGREGAEEVGGRGYAQGGALGYGWGEMFGVISEQPVGFAGYSGEQCWDVCGVADSVATGTDVRGSGVRNQFRMRQRDQAMVMFDEFVAFARR